MEKKWIFLSAFAVTFIISQIWATLPPNMDVTHVKAVDSDPIRIEPLRQQGKIDNSPFESIEGKQINIWATQKRSKDKEETLNILKAQFNVQGIPLNGKEEDNSVLLFPGGVQDSLLVWQDDTVFFSVDSHLANSHSPSIMLCSPGTVRHEMRHLGGVLHLKYESKQLEDGQRIVVEADSSHILSGLFYATLGASELQMTAISGSSSKSVEVSSLSKEVYIPMPCGDYKELVIYIENSNGDVLASYDFENIIIERGSITTKSLPKEKKDGKGIISKRARIEKLYLYQHGNCINPSKHEVQTKDPESLSAKTEFSDEVVGLLHNKVHVTHLNCRYNPITFNHYVRYLSNEKSYSPKDSYWHFPAELKLNPGENRFRPTAIVLKKNGKSNSSQYITGPTEKVWLFIKTYTCDFDYKNFAQQDTLCGYVPEWNTRKLGSESYIDWEFKPNDDEAQKVTNRIKDLFAHKKDNHLKHPLNLPGSRQISFWTAATERVEDYLVVKHGVARYQAVTVYRKTDGSVKYREATSEPRSFTTDIIEIDRKVNRQNDGSLEFTGRFRTGFIRSFGESIKFEPSYFDGKERGFIVVAEEEYKQANNKICNISKNKHVSKSKSGEEFKCVISDIDPSKRYYIWSYLQIGNYLFLGDPVRYPEEDGIFGDLPALYDPYTSYLAPFANDYVDKYYISDKNNTGRAYGDMKDAEKRLRDVYEELRDKVESKSAHATTVDYLRYSTEEDLPYTIIEPIEYGIGGGYSIFEEIPLYNGLFLDVSMGLLNIIDAEPVSVIKQYPMVYAAMGKMKIQLKSLEQNNSLLGRLSGVMPINGYVPGNGPDGKRLCRLSGIASIAGKKPGDIVDALVVIIGWGPREIVDQMRSVVFTKEDPDKDKANKSITIKRLGSFPHCPCVDWMDEWYEAMKVKYANKFKPSTKVP